MAEPEGLKTAVMMMTREDGQIVSRRRVAPGEVELSIAAALQFIASIALFLAPGRLLAGNGTALLTLADHPQLTYYAKSFWGALFLAAGFMCVVALREPRIATRRVAWQVVIPLWACWLCGLMYPLFVGLPTNIILIAAACALVLQWLVTRILVPLDSPWYSREVPLAVERQGESQVVECGS